MIEQSKIKNLKAFPPNVLTRAARVISDIQLCETKKIIANRRIESSPYPRSCKRYNERVTALITVRDALFYRFQKRTAELAI